MKNTTDFQLMLPVAYVKIFLWRREQIVMAHFDWPKKLFLTLQILKFPSLGKRNIFINQTRQGKNEYLSLHLISRPVILLTCRKGNIFFYIYQKHWLLKAMHRILAFLKRCISIFNWIDTTISKLCGFFHAYFGRKPM